MSAAVQGVPRPAQPMLGGRTAGLYPNIRPPHLKTKSHTEDKPKPDSSKKKITLTLSQCQAHQNHPFCAAHCICSYLICQPTTKKACF